MVVRRHLLLLIVKVFPMVYSIPLINECLHWQSVLLIKYQLQLPSKKRFTLWWQAMIKPSRIKSFFRFCHHRKSCFLSQMESSNSWRYVNLISSCNSKSLSWSIAVCKSTWISFTKFKSSRKCHRKSAIDYTVNICFVRWSLVKKLIIS